jgi:RND family efflux transporter MFP subunit
VTVAAVEPGSVLDATGYVVARRQATVSAKTTGKVSQILVEEGMQVAAGQVIARLDDTLERAQVALARAELDAARAALAELDAGIEHAGRMLQRLRALADRALVSLSDLDERALAAETLHARRGRAHREVAVAARRLDLQRQRLADMEIRAPFAGVVVDKAAQPGEMVSPLSAGGGFTRTGVGTIVDMSSLEVEVDVNEAYINRVHPAQAVIVTLNAYPERRYAAEVLAVIPAADRSKATVGVRVGFLELDRRVLPEMGVRVAFLPTRNQREDDS